MTVKNYETTYCIDVKEENVNQEMELALVFNDQATVGNMTMSDILIRVACNTEVTIIGNDSLSLDQNIVIS